MFSIIGLVLGSIYGGLLGAVFGFFIGGYIDRLILRKRIQMKFGRRSRLGPDDFVDSLMKLTAVVIKADQRMLRSELDYVKQYLINSIGASKAQVAILKLRDYLNQDIDVDEVCSDLTSKANIQDCLLIMQFLFGLAQADGQIEQSEIEKIRNIAFKLGISSSDFDALKSMFLGRSNFGYGSGSYGYGGGGYSGYSESSSSYDSSSYNNLDNDYKILEVSPDASDDEVKKAYRKAAMKHHPDKASHLGEEMRKAAEEKFAKVNEAYNRIKKSRGMN